MGRQEIKQSGPAVPGANEQRGDKYSYPRLSERQLAELSDEARATWLPSGVNLKTKRTTKS